MQTITYRTFEAHFGPMLLGATPLGICWLSPDLDVQRIAARYPAATLVADEGELSGLAEQVAAALADPWLAGELPFDPQGTSFQQRVWAELRRIQPGETRFYRDIAMTLGDPAATRAVGSANAANPVAILIPCHRVIAADGSLGGYAWGLQRKQELLEAEGARFAHQPSLI